MKKLFISTIILCLFVNENLFAQAVSITPTGDEILITKYGSGTPNLAGRQSSGSSTTPTASTVNMGLATFAARGHSGTSFTGNRAAINMDADQTFTATAQGTRITFFTTLNGTTSNTERVRIDNTGKVGIGSTDPLGKLQINHDTDANDDFPHIRLRQLSDANFGRLRFENSDGTRYFMNKISLGSVTPSLNSFRWTYGTTELMRLNGDGDVGIGTASPDTRLHVLGTVDNNGTDATFKVTNGASSMLFDGNEIDVASNGAMYLNYNTTGNIYLANGGGRVAIGNNGSLLNEVIKATVNIPTFSVGANACVSQTVTVANAAIDSAVSCTPDIGLTQGLVVAYSRVSSTGNVLIRICNYTGASITQGTSDYHIGIVR